MCRCPGSLHRGLWGAVYKGTKRTPNDWTLRKVQLRTGAQFPAGEDPADPRKIPHPQRAGRAEAGIWALGHGLGGNRCPRGRGFLELSRSPRPAGKIHRIGFRTSARRRPRAGTSPQPLPAQFQDSRNPLRGVSNRARLPGNRLPRPVLAGVVRSDARHARAQCMAGARGFRPARGRAVPGG